MHINPKGGTEVANEGNPFRTEIEQLIRGEDLRGLLKKAGELHGHWCNYLAYGVKAGCYGIKEMGVTNTGMEEIIAIVETNNCFSDGIQMITGCTFGNNSLIYRDLGKTVVTLSKRDGQAIRIALAPEFEDSRGQEYPEVYSLFDRLVAKREPGEPQEYAKMMQLFADMSVDELSVPIDTMFRIRKLTIDVPEYAPIFDSEKCAICGENIMATRLTQKDGNSVCLDCSRAMHSILSGAGISLEG
jgi:formylmethanofuran dehydrogenase subunit E